MSQLESLKDTKASRVQRKRVGRGIGSGMGKTACRGTKGAKSRSGYKRRLGTEGGALPLFKKLPTRGFSNARFRRRLDAVNLELIEQQFNDGEIVNIDTLTDKGLLSGPSYGVKILSEGTITKKLTFEVHSLSKVAREKLEEAKIEFKLLI
jgi:large subunit ribosomal protein L15